MTSPRIFLHRPPVSRRSPRLRRFVLTIAPLLLGASLASAATLTWDPGQTPATPTGGTGQWDLTNTNWSNGTADQVWPNVSANDDKAIFGGTAGTVTLASNLTAGGITFNTSGYVLTSLANALTLSPQVSGGVSLAVGAGVTGISISLPVLVLTGATSGTLGALTNTDNVNFNNTIVAFSGARQATLANSSATATTTFTNFAVTSTNNPSNNPTFQLNTGNLTIANLGAAVSGAGATAALAAGNSTNNGAITFSGTSTGTLTLNGNNTLLNNAGTGFVTVNLNVANATYNVGNDNAFGARDASGAATDTVLNVSSGTLVATGGARTLANNTLLSGNAAIGGANAVTFSGTFTNNGGNRTLTVNNTAATTLSGNVFVSEAQATGRTLTVAGTGNTTISGNIADSAAGVTTGTAGGLTKTGVGVLTLTGANNTYTGATNVTGGTLLVNSTAGTGVSTVTVNGAGSVLGGTGTITGPLTLTTGTVTGGTLGGVGTLTLTNTATIAANGTFQVDISGATSDRLTIGGTLAITNGATLVFNGTTTPGTTYTLATYASETGQFTVSNLPANSTLTYGANALTLTTAVPEPSTWASCVVAGLGGIWMLRRRRSRA